MESAVLISEKSVVKKVETYLEDCGWNVLGKVKIRGGYPDIVAVKDSKILVVEAKGGLGDVVRGVGQIIHYSVGAHYAYLALPKKMIDKNITSVLEGVKIGLFEVDEIVAEKVKPSERAPIKSILRKILKLPKQKLTKSYEPNSLRIFAHPKLLLLLLKKPEREFTMLELSKESGVPYATAWRLVRVLDALGIILTRKIGSSTACKLNKASPYLRTLKIITEETPHRMAFELFKNKIKSHPNIKKIYLFGSVAAGNERSGSDVDVAIIVKKQFKKFEKWLNVALISVLKKTQINIVPLVFTHKNMPKHFKKEIEKGELAYARN